MAIESLLTSCPGRELGSNRSAPSSRVRPRTASSRSGVLTSCQDVSATDLGICIADGRGRGVAMHKVPNGDCYSTAPGVAGEQKRRLVVGWDLSGLIIMSSGSCDIRNSSQRSFCTHPSLFFSFSLQCPNAAGRKHTSRPHFCAVVSEQACAQ